MDEHLRLRAAGRLDDDLRDNYAPDVVLLCETGALRGREAVRESGLRLQEQLAGASYEYLRVEVVGEYALLRWRAESGNYLAENGFDTFVIRDGRIVMQSVYYTLVEKVPRGH